MAAWQERFWAKAPERPDVGCWEWTAAKNPEGYGWFRRVSRGGMEMAHRVAFDIAFGGLQPRLPVMHSCDNPGCVRPDHLEQGSQQRNMTDCLRRGRLTNAKLTEDMVRDIRGRSPEEGPCALGREFGISHASVIRIRNGTSWKHVT